MVPTPWCSTSSPSALAPLLKGLPSSVTWWWWRARVGIGDAFYELDFFGVSGAANLPYTIGLLDMIRLKMELTPHRSSLRMRLPKNPRHLMPGAVMPTKPANWRGDSEWEPFQRVHMYWKSFWVHLQLQ